MEILLVELENSSDKGTYRSFLDAINTSSGDLMWMITLNAVSITLSLTLPFFYLLEICLL